MLITVEKWLMKCRLKRTLYTCVIELILQIEVAYYKCKFI